MKKDIFLHSLFAGLILLSSINSYGQSSLCIFKNDDSQINSWLISQIKITFSENNLLVYNGNSTTNIPLNNIRKITFSSTNTNVSTENFSNSLTLYPNPVSNILHLKNLNSENLTVRIFSIDGKAVLTRTLSTYHTDIDVTILPKGLYILKANDQTIRFTKK